MGNTKRIGRLGGLAVGLGIGAAMAATPGVAAADNTVDGGASAVLNGDSIVPVSYSPETIISTVSNPLDTQVIGDQAFYLDLPGGTLGNEFYATVSDTTYSFGSTDEYIDVYFSNEKLPPEIGSIVNVLNYGGGFENAYSDIVGSAPADEIITPFGDVAVPTGIVEFLGPDFFIPSIETMSSSAASAIDPSSLIDALDPTVAAVAADLSSDLSSLLGLL